MMISNEIIEMYKKNPKRHEFDKGFQRASLDYWCGEKLIFEDKHSRAFRDGYVAGYAKSVTFDNPSQCVTEEDIERIKQDICNELDRIASVKYVNAIEVKDEVDWDAFKAFIESNRTEKAAQ